MKQKQFLNGTLNLSLVVPKIENCKHKFFIVNLQNTICFSEKGILWSKDCHILRRENLHNNNNNNLPRLLTTTQMTPFLRAPTLKDNAVTRLIYCWITFAKLKQTLRNCTCT